MPTPAHMHHLKTGPLGGGRGHGTGESEVMSARFIFANGTALAYYAAELLAARYSYEMDYPAHSRRWWLRGISISRHRAQRAQLQRGPAAVEPVLHRRQSGVQHHRSNRPQAIDEGRAGAAGIPRR